MKTLILGGIRSGKSRLAVQLGLPVTYLATATADDAAMVQRIAAHKDARPAHWQTIEEPLALGDALAQVSGACIIIDCLTLWLTNLLLCDDDRRLHKEQENLLTILTQSTSPIILVANETSMGIIPLGELTRRYCDLAGSLHQRLASTCDRVVFTVAGLPMMLKGEPI